MSQLAFCDFLIFQWCSQISNDDPHLDENCLNDNACLLFFTYSILSMQRTSRRKGQPSYLGCFLGLWYYFWFNCSLIKLSKYHTVQVVVELMNSPSFRGRLPRATLVAACLKHVLAYDLAKYTSLDRTCSPETFSLLEQKAGWCEGLTCWWLTIKHS